MSFVKCFDAVNMVLEEATDRFAPLWHPDTHRVAELHRCCGAVDAVVDEFNGTCFDIEVDEQTMEIHLELVCERIVVESNSPLLPVIQCSRDARIVRDKDGSLGLHFVFAGIWRYQGR